MFLDFWSNLLKCHPVNVLYSEKVNLKRGIILLKSRETLKINSLKSQYDVTGHEISTLISPCLIRFSNFVKMPD